MKKIRVFFKKVLQFEKKCDIITDAVRNHTQGYSSAGRVPVSKTVGRGFESSCPCQQKQNICLPTNVLFLFIQAAGLVYHHDAVVYIISPFGAVSHHAPACISLRLDDIQHYVLMIYRNKLRMIYKAYALICF